MTLSKSLMWRPHGRKKTSAAAMGSGGEAAEFAGTIGKADRADRRRAEYGGCAHR